jgi:MFS family permease
LDLACQDKGKIAMLGGIAFAGWVAGSLFITRLSDLHGRVNLLILMMVLQLLLLIALMISNNLTLTLVIMFFEGVVSSGRWSIGYVLIMEFLPVQT